MNKAYKVIWSKVKGCYVVVSELAKERGKNNSRGKHALLAGIVMATLLGGVSLPAGTVFAADPPAAPPANNIYYVAVGVDTSKAIEARKYPGETIEESAVDPNANKYFPLSPTFNFISIGAEASAGANGAVAMGFKTTAKGEYATALGTGSGAYSKGDIALGWKAYTGWNEPNKIAIGTESFSSGANGISIGTKSKTWDKDAIAIGNEAETGPGTSQDTIAIGRKARVYGQKSVAIGALATTGDNSSPGAQIVAIGHDTHAYQTNSVAIGSESTAFENATVIGNDSHVGQQSVALGSTIRAGEWSVAIGLKSKAHDYAIAMGTNSDVSGKYAIGIGEEARSFSINSVSIGHDAHAYVGESLAVGNSALVAGERITKTDYDALSEAEKKNYTLDSYGNFYYKTDNGTYHSTAVGPQARTYGKNATALGSANVGRFEDKNGMADGGTAIGSSSNAAYENATAIGYKSVAYAKDAVTIGVKTRAAADGAVALGANAGAAVEGAVSLGSDAQATVEAGVYGYDPFDENRKQETSTWKSTKGAVSVGDTGQKITRQITNVAAGTKDSDAVNVAQLKNLKYRAYWDLDAAEKRLNKGIQTNAGNITNLSKKVKVNTDGITYLTNQREKDILNLHQTIEGHTTRFVSVNRDNTNDTSSNYLNDGATEIGSIAIGHNAHANGKQAVTLGYNSFAKGQGSVVIGESSDNDTGGEAAKKGQFDQSIILGAKNRIAAQPTESGGREDKIIGNMNIVDESHGTFVRGTGNSVYDAYNDEALTDEDKQKERDFLDRLHGGDPTGLFQKGRSHVTVDGDGNLVQGALYTRVSGVGNEVSNTDHDDGTSTPRVTYNIVTGNRNTVIDSSHNLIIGDNHELENVNGNIIIGSLQTKAKTTASNVTILGNEANASVDGGVALGNSSVAGTAAGVAGYDPATKAASTKADKTWESTLAAVSVGNATGTRQITGVAAGFADTDAVNVAQLKALKENVGGGVRYYSVKSDQQGAGTNYANDGAKAADSMVIGISSSISEKAKNSTVLGNNNTLSNQPNARGVERDGENNSIVVGQNLTVEGAQNAVFGTGSQNNNNKKLTHVAGDRNTVIGVGNLVGYTAERVGTEWKYTKFKGHGDDENVVVGLTNTVNGGGVVVGTNTTVSAYGGVAFGHHNIVSGDGDKGVALGNDLNVSGYGALAVGTESTATGDYTIALGVESKAQAQMAASMGYDSQAKASGSVALGAWSSAEAKQALALGYDSQAMVAGGVALGAKSVANRGKDVLGYDPVTGAAFANDAAVAAALGKTAELTAAEANITTAQTTVTAAQQAYDADQSEDNERALRDAKKALAQAENAKGVLLSTYKSTLAAVSVGDASTRRTRQITGVAAGREDTDAVNVAQLKALNQKVDGDAIHYVSVTGVDKTHPADSNYFNDGAKGDGGIAIGEKAVSGGRGIALGRDSKAKDKGTLNINAFEGIAIGNEANTEVSSGIAVGTRAHVDGTLNSQDGNVNELGTIAFGTDTHAIGTGAAAFGWKSKAKDEGAMAFGTETTAEMAGTAVGAHSHAAPGGTAMGWQANAQDRVAVSIGTSSDAAKQATALGAGTTAGGIASTALGLGAKAQTKFGVALGAKSVANTEAGKIGYVAVGSNATFDDLLTALGKKEAYDDWTAKVNASKSEFDQLTAAYDNAANDSDKAAAKTALDAWKNTHGDFVEALSAKTSLETAWKSNMAAVSVGRNEVNKAGNTVVETRQITNLAAGTEDTDAVNVAQLKAGTKWTIKDSESTPGSKTIDATNPLVVQGADGVTAKVDDAGLHLGLNKTDLSNTINNGPVITNVAAKFKVGAESGTEKTVTADKTGTQTIKFTGDGNIIESKVTTDGVQYKVNETKLNTAITNNTTVQQNKTDITALQSGFTVSNAAGTKQDITLGGASKQNIKFQGETDKIDVTVEADGTAGAKVTVKANAKLGENIDLSNNSTITTINNNITTLQGGFKVKSGTNEGAIKAGDTLEFAGKNYVDTQYDAAEKKLTIGLDDATKNKIDNINTTINETAQWTIKDSGSGKKVINKDNELVVQGADGVTAKVDDAGLHLGLNKTDLSNTINNGPVITNVAAKFKVGAESGGDKTVTADKTGTQTIKFTGDGNIIESEVTTDGVKYKVNGTNLNTAITNNTTVQQNKTDITALQGGFTVSNAAGTKQDITLGGASKQNIKFQGETDKIDVTVEADGTAGAKVTVKANAKLGENIDLSNNSTITTINNNITTLQGGFNVKSGTKEGAIKAGDTLEFAGKNYVDTQYDATKQKLTIGLDDATKTKIDNINTTIGAAAKWTIQDSESTPGSKTIDATTPLVVQGADGVTAKVDTTKGLQLGLDKTELSNTINNGPVITNVEAKFKVGADSGTDKPVTADKTGTQTIKFTGDGNIIESKVTSDGVQYKVNETKLKDTLSNTFAKTDASNLTGDNVTQWREKLGVTDHALSQASAWKLQVNGGSERVIGKDDVVNFVAGSYTEVTATGNDVKIGLNDAAKEKLAKVDTLEGKIKANKVQVTGDDATGVKVADKKEADGSTTYKVSLGEKIKVGGVTMDGAGANRTITGLTNTGLDVAGFATSKRAATEEQLQAAMTQMSANAKATKVESGDENIVVSKTTEGQNENKYTVELNKNLNVDSLNAGGTTVNKDGISVQGADGKPGVTITKDGIDAGGQTIRNVKPGEKLDDAATVGQLKDLAGAAGNGLNELGNQIGRLDGRVNKVGAGAAALAALHPVDFDADDKLDVAAGWGHYKGRNAMALGAFYRPDERTMFSLGGTVGNGENMINAGITFKLDKRRGPIHAITSKVQLVQEVTQLKADNDELRKDNAELREQMKEINAKLEKLMAAK